MLGKEFVKGLEEIGIEYIYELLFGGVELTTECQMCKQTYEKLKKVVKEEMKRQGWQGELFG